MTTNLSRKTNRANRGSFHVYESWLRRLDRLPRLLLAEDHRDTRETLTQYFERLGYDVRAVADGSALLHRLGPMLLSEPGHWPPDVILTDVKMPGVDPLSVLKEMRETGWTVPAVAITGFDTDDVRKRLEEMKEATYLVKPLNIEELQRAVEESVGEPHPKF